MFQDRGNLFQFVTLEKDLAPAGRLNEEMSWQFDFKQVRGGERERARRVSFFADCWCCRWRSSTRPSTA
jgi:hypothetical protein